MNTLDSTASYIIQKFPNGCSPFEIIEALSDFTTHCSWSQLFNRVQEIRDTQALYGWII